LFNHFFCLTFSSSSSSWVGVVARFSQERDRLPGADCRATFFGGHLGSPGLTPLALAAKWGRPAMVELLTEWGRLASGPNDSGGGASGESGEWLGQGGRAAEWQPGAEDPNAFVAFAAKPKADPKGVKLKLAFGGVAAYLKAKDRQAVGGAGGAAAVDQQLWAAAGGEARAKVTCARAPVHARPLRDEVRF
jgi:hypothetical protein